MSRKARDTALNSSIQIGSAILTKCVIFSESEKLVDKVNPEFVKTAHRGVLLISYSACKSLQFAAGSLQKTCHL